MTPFRRSFSECVWKLSSEPTTTDWCARYTGLAESVCVFILRLVVTRKANQEKLLIASCSESKVSKTVNSFVIASRSSIRLVR